MSSCLSGSHVGYDISHQFTEKNENFREGLAIPCTADIITVDDDGPADFNNIQAVIYAAVNGDEVVVADGVYNGEGNRDINFLGKAIMVCSENGPNNCIIDCNSTEAETHYGFFFHNQEDANSTLGGFTITDGYAKRFGGTIYCDYSSPVIRNCIITNNNAS